MRTHKGIMLIHSDYRLDESEKLKELNKRADEVEIACLRYDALCNGKLGQPLAHEFVSKYELRTNTKYDHPFGIKFIEPLVIVHPDSAIENPLWLSAKYRVRVFSENKVGHEIFERETSNLENGSEIRMRLSYDEPNFGETSFLFEDL